MARKWQVNNRAHTVPDWRQIRAAAAHLQAQAGKGRLGSLTRRYIRTGSCGHAEPKRLSRNPPVHDPALDFSLGRGRLQLGLLSLFPVSLAQSTPTATGEESAVWERWPFPAQVSQTQEWKIPGKRTGFTLTERLEFKPETFQGFFSFLFI